MIGWRLDERPCPILYVGPTLRFLNEQFEPRLMELFDQAPSLNAKLMRGRRMSRTRKIVGGVSIRLGYGGSPSSLKSEPIGFAIVDEYVDMKRRIQKSGDPLTLTELRGESYPDFVTVVISTPSEGIVETAIDPVNGCELWSSDPDEVTCPQFKLFLEGTRRHFAWVCAGCGELFIPRFKQLRWPQGATPYQALSAAWVECPKCQHKHREIDKAKLNKNAVFIAPGQRFADGEVIGEAPESTSDSYWTSGLCSPFKTFGERAEAFLSAAKSGDMEKIQGVINGAFAELWAPSGGDTPEVSEVMACRQPYYNRGAGEECDIPSGVRRITAGVDVQKNRLIVTVRGWGARGESWRLKHVELWGRTAEGELSDTGQPEVWNDLHDLLDARFGHLRIMLMLIDSGYRPNKKETGAESIVYDFCRRHQRHTRPAKGALTLASPLIISRIEVTPAGRLAKYGLELARVNTDYWKLWVHEHIRWPQDQPGAWHLPMDVTDDYCAQLLSESRLKTPSGRPKWVERSHDNHALDTESLCAAAGYLLNVHRMPSAGRPAARAALPVPQAQAREEQAPPVPVPKAQNRPMNRKSYSSFIGKGQG